MQILSPKSWVLGLDKDGFSELSRNIIKETWTPQWHTDSRKGLHCCNCGEENNTKLLSSRKGVLCINCFANGCKLFGWIDYNKSHEVTDADSSTR